MADGWKAQLVVGGAGRVSLRRRRTCRRGERTHDHRVAAARGSAYCGRAPPPRAALADGVGPVADGNSAGRGRELATAPCPPRRRVRALPSALPGPRQAPDLAAPSPDPPSPALDLDP